MIGQIGVSHGGQVGGGEVVTVGQVGTGGQVGGGEVVTAGQAGTGGQVTGAEVVEVLLRLLGKSITRGIEHFKCSGN